MDFFRGIGDWFRGAFGGNKDDEEEKRRRQQQQQNKPKPTPPPITEINKLQNVNDMFGAKKSPYAVNSQPKKSPFQTATPEDEKKVAPRVEAPRVQQPTVNYQELAKRAQAYQKPKVQDVNNYYGNDLSVLNKELAKGDKADVKRVEGLMKSLDNRKKELEEFHSARGKDRSFVSARELDKKIKETRGDWTKEQATLKSFWDGVSRNEKSDFIKYLNEKNGTNYQPDQIDNILKNPNTPTAPTVNLPGSWKTGTGAGSKDLSEELENVNYIKQRQELADVALEMGTVPLTQLNNRTFNDYLDSFDKQDASEQRKTIKNLEKYLQDNQSNISGDKTIEEKFTQTYMLLNLLEDRGQRKTDFKTNLADFGEGLAGFGAALIESPGRVIQSADILGREMFMGGRTQLDELQDAFKAGEIDADEYNRRYNEYNRSREWAGTGSGGKGRDALQATGIAADTVATFLPVGSIYKGVKGANASRNLIAAGMKNGMSREAAEAFAREEMKALVNEGAQRTLNQTAAREAGINAGFSATGSLREGEFDPTQMAVETALGAGLGAGATYAGSGAGKLWNRLRAARETAPELVEDIGRATSRLGSDASEEAVEGTIEAELRAIVNDPTRPPFQRKQAQDILDTQKRDPEVPVAPESGIDRPAYMVKRDIQRAIQEEEDKLNRFINENQNATPDQIEAVRQASRERIDKLIEDIQISRMANEETLGQQADEINQAAETRAETIQEVQDNQQRTGSPAPGDPIDPSPTGNPEVLANDAYASQYTDTASMTDTVLRRAGIDPTAPDSGNGGWRKIFHKATGGIISDKYKEMVDKIRDVVADINYRAAESGNIFSQAPGRLMTLFNQNTVLKDSLRQMLRVRNDMQSAAGDAVKRLHDDLSSKVARLNNPQFNQTLDQLFESPEFLARKYGEGTPNVRLDDLPPAEREIAETLIEMNKLRNLALFRQGRISQGEYQMFANGMHSPRLYDFEKSSMGMGRGNKLIDTTSTKKRKNLEDISDETFDKLIESPAQRMLIRLEMALRSQASNDALKALDQVGMLKNSAPNNQFSKLEGARWGDFEGKYVFNPVKSQLSDALVANTDTGQKVTDLIDKYRESGFGKVDRFMKKTKTVYSPGTFIGNVASNPLLFNRGAGVNAIGQTGRMAKAGADLVNHRTGRGFVPDIYEAQKYGVFSSDTGKQITGENNPQLSVTKGKKTNPFEAAYGGADDAAKLAIWRTLRGRGVEPELAARRVAQFTQDYNNAGILVRNLADMPVLGRPFARFAPELVRLVKNNIAYNPAGMVAGVGMIALIQKELSDMAGESPEAREARETGMGQTLIPGTKWLNKMLTGTDRDISLNFPVGDSAINVARAVGLNFPIDESGDPNMSLIKSLAPWAIPTREDAGGDLVLAPEELFTSLAWNPIARQVANRDFMGREITDPENRVRFEEGGNILDSQYENPDGTRQSPGEGQENMNRLEHLFMSYVPLANESQSLYNAFKGQDDYYGKTRSVPDAIARVFGAKAESNTPEAQEARVGTKRYFEEDLPAVQDFLRTNPDLQGAYLNLKSTSRDRNTDISTNDLITPEKWDVINSDTSGRLFNFLKEQAIIQHERSQDEARLNPGALVKPLDPIYTLPEEQVRYVAELRSRPSGDDIEAQEILRATTDWFPAYEERYWEYLNQNSAFFDSLPERTGGAKTNPRVEAYSEASVPVEQPAIIKEYYQIKERDPELAKQVYRANKDALSAAFDQYAVDRLARINAQRAIEGYEPISLETFKNDTFGFDRDGSGGGYGGGGGGGGGSREYETNMIGNITDFSSGINRLEEAEAQAMPELQKLFAGLRAGRGGGRAKPRLGAGSRGQ